MKLVSKYFEKDYFLLSCILLLALWFRIQGFLYSTFAFTYDVGRDLLAVQQIITTHKPALIGQTTGIHGIFYGPTWYYLLLPMFLLSNGNPRGVVLFMMLSGIVTCFVGFLLGKKIGGYTLGIIFSLFLALSQVMTEIAAQIWNPNIIPLFVSIVSLIIISLTGKKTTRSLLHAFVFGLILGIIFDLEIVFGLLFLIAIVIFLVIFKRQIIRLKESLLIISGFIFIQLPRFIFEIRHDFLMTKTFFTTLTSQSHDPLVTLQPHFIKIGGILLEVFTNTVAWQNTYIGILLLTAMLAIFLFTFKRLDRKEKDLFYLCAVVLGVFWIGLSFFNHDIESHYYIGIPLVYILLLGLSVYYAYKYLRIPKILIVIIIIIIYGICLNQLKLLGTFQKSTWVGDASVYRNQLAVVDYIYQDAGGKKFNTITYTPPIFDYPYQYLFLWRGMKKYGYTPSKDKQLLFYLIVEPDSQYPFRQLEWLKIRKDDGKITFTKTFPSGITLQKRFH